MPAGVGPELVADGGVADEEGDGRGDLPLQVRQLAEEGFAIGVHTASHARLAGLPSATQRAAISCAEALWTIMPLRKT